MNTRELIHALGGVVRIGKTLGVSPSVVGNWHIRGVPWRLRPAVAELAASKGIDVPNDFLITSPEAA